MRACDIAKIGPNVRRKQVQRALPILWNERVQENQSLKLRCPRLCHAADDHARITVTCKDYIPLGFRHRDRNVLDVFSKRNVGRQMSLVTAKSAEDWGHHLMAVLFQQGDQEIPGAGRLPCTMHQDER